MATISSDTGIGYVISAKDQTKAAVNSATAGTKRVGTATERMAARTKLHLANMRKHWFAMTAAVAAVAASTQRAIRAAMEQESAEMKLAVAMGNAGTYTRENFRAMKEYAAQLQQVTKYGDEATLAMMANLQTYGMSTGELKAATVAAMDLAAAKGIDLKAASELVGKAFVGETGTLSRYGIVLEDGIEKSDKFQAVLKLIQERFGGTARAELETYGGQWKQIANWWGDIMEKVGLGVLKTLEAVQTAFGLVAAGFYTILEKITAGLVDVFQKLEQVPIIGEKLAGITAHFKTIEGGYASAKEAALKFANTNYEMLGNFERVETFADKTFGGISTAANAASRSETEAALRASAEKQKTLAEFSDKYRQLTLGDREYAVQKLKEQGDAYVAAGAARLEVEKWLQAEIAALDQQRKDAEDAEAVRLAEEKAAETQRLLQEKQRIADEFSEVYREMTLGEHEYELLKVQEMADAYRAAGADKIAVAEWVTAETKALDEKYLKQAADIAKKEARLKSQGYQDMANNAAVFFKWMGEQSLVAWRMYQGIEIAQTMASTYEAAQAAYAWGMKYGGPAGPALAAAAAAAAVAAGVARVAQIASLTPDSSGATGVYSADSSTGLPVAETSTGDEDLDPEGEEQRSFSITINNYGYMNTDEDGVARDLVPRLRKAIADGV